MKRLIALGLMLVMVSATTYAGAFALNGLEYDGKYDYSSVLWDGNFGQMANDWPRIFASGRRVFVNEATKERTVGDVAEQSGRAVVFYPYVLALYHYVDLSEETQSVITPFGIRSVTVKADEVIEEKYWLSEGKNKDARKVALEKIVFLPDEDLALFKISDNAEINHPKFIVGRSDELMVGHIIFLLGSPQLLGPSVRRGIVAGFGSHWDKEQWEAITGKNEISLESAVILSIGAMPGDSGSPVVALRDGRLELVGLLEATLGQAISFMIAIDAAIQKILEKTGIDLRKISER